MTTPQLIIRGVVAIAINFTIIYAACEVRYRRFCRKMDAWEARTISAMQRSAP